MKKILIRSGVTEQSAKLELQRLVDNSNLPEHVIETLWENACSSVISIYKISPDNAYYWDLVLKSFKTALINKLGENLGPDAKKALEVGYDNLPYI